MKTLEQVKDDVRKRGFDNPDSVVYTIENFAEKIKKGSIIPLDGVGYFHDGEKETEFSVFSHQVSFYEAYKKYPYVCWYNK